MGTKPQGPGQSNQPAAGAKNPEASIRPASMPLSVSPQALAQHLDDGWGDDSATTGGDEPADSVRIARGIVNVDASCPSPDS
ncbi:MAG TPA: hypothetical protein VIV60_33115, partial [Polyangiaceae bacterium]